LYDHPGKKKETGRDDGLNSPGKKKKKKKENTRGIPMLSSWPHPQGKKEDISTRADRKKEKRGIHPVETSAYTPPCTYW